MNKEAKIISISAIVIIIGVVVLLAFGPKNGVSIKSVSVDATKLANETSHMTGSLGAKVTIVEFGDYECPACAVFNTVVKQTIDTYGKNPDFNFVFRNFPLSQHKNALRAAEAAEAAGGQGKFWEMEQLLYAKQSDWAETENPTDLFVSYAQSLSLDVAKFKSDIENKKYEAFIKSDQADGLAINVSWTPSIYVNGELLQSMPSFEELKSKIDSLLNK